MLLGEDVGVPVTLGVTAGEGVLLGVMDGDGVVDGVGPVMVIDSELAVMPPPEAEMVYVPERVPLGIVKVVVPLAV